MKLTLFQIVILNKTSTLLVGEECRCYGESCNPWTSCFDVRSLQQAMSKNILCEVFLETNFLSMK